MEFKHIPVMKDECMDGLDLKNGGIYFDGTLGGAGHSFEILNRTKDSRLIATDLDLEAIDEATKKLSCFGNRFTLVHDNFKNFKRIMETLGVEYIDGALLDLGVSSHQLDDRSRGFSYMAEDERLDMRMNSEAKFSAFDVVNSYSADKLKKIISDYGEEKFAYKIADAIVSERQKKSVETCGELVNIIRKVIPQRFVDGHPAKRTFQAIRIEVNGELEGLSEAITDMVYKLKKGGRIAVITFHSLEDRLVKNTFKELETDCICDKSLPICVCGKRQEIKLVNKKPIVASDDEIVYNPRSKSAKLRIAERM